MNLWIENGVELYKVASNLVEQVQQMLALEMSVPFEVCPLVETG